MSPEDMIIIGVFILVTIYAIKGTIEYWQN